MPGVLESAPKYLVQQQLSAGGMGAVHLGTMVSHAGERRVAIKRLLPRGDAGREGMERIVAEARLVFQLTQANICQVLDLASNDEGAFIVMEYVDGCDLQTLLRGLRRRGRWLDVSAAVHVAREVAKALDYAHRRTDARGRPMRLVHGDVKPSNILLSRESEVKLADFGIARALGAHAPGNQLHGGTPGYMAPEVEGGPSDQRADVYSLGVTLWVALGGTEDGAAHGRAALLDERPEISSELIGIIERATAARPESRYPVAAELERALGLHLAHQFPSFAPSTIGTLVTAQATQDAAPAQAERSVFTLSSLTHVSRQQAGPIADQSSSAETPAATPRRTQRVTPGAKGGHARRVALALLVIGAGAAFVPWHRFSQAKPTPPLPPEKQVDVAAAGLTAERALDDTVVVSPSPTPSFRSPRPRGGEKRQATRASDRRPASPATVEVGYLSVNADPWGAVVVDGKKVAEQTPAYRLAVATGVHRITIYNPERKRSSQTKLVEVQRGKNAVVGFEW
jgi:serine/threonine protein kinase